MRTLLLLAIVAATAIISVPATAQHSKGKLPLNGTINTRIGPLKPAGVGDKNWIQTVGGRNFIAAIRLYGTGIEFFDQTWKPDDVVKVK